MPKFELIAASAFAAVVLAMGASPLIGSASAQQVPRTPVANGPPKAPKVPAQGFFTKVDVLVDGRGYVIVGKDKCGSAEPGTKKCTFTVPIDALVQFNAEAVPGSYIDHWYGACELETGTTCSRKIGSGQLVGAAFVTGKP